MLNGGKFEISMSTKVCSNHFTAGYCPDMYVEQQCYTLKVMPQNQLNVPLIHATTTKKCWQVILDGSEDIYFETQTPNVLEHDYVVENRVIIVTC